MRHLKLTVFVLIILALPAASAINKTVTFNFEDMEITDILKAVSVNYGINIIPEKDVTGRHSIHITDMPLKTALNSFLAAKGYKMTEKDGIFTVSRIKENPYIRVINNKLTLRADNVPINEILRNISLLTNLNIITSQPMDIKITAHLNNVEPLQGLIKILNENGLAITRDAQYLKVYPVKPKYTVLYNPETDKMSIEAVNTEILEILNEIGRKTGNNIVIEDAIRQNVTINLIDVDFVTGLNTLLNIYGLKMAKYQNIYKIFKDNEGFKIPVSVRNNLVTADIRNGDLETALRQIAAQIGYGLVLFKDIRNRVTAQLNDAPLENALDYLLKNTPFSFKLDEKQKILFIGSAAVDQNESDLFNTRVVYKFNYFPVRQLQTVLPRSFTAANMKVMSEINSVILTAPENLHNEFKEFIKILDEKPNQKIFSIKHMEARDFISILPDNLPSMPVKIITEQNAILVSGTPEMIEAMEKLVNKLDVKPAQVMIEILVVEMSDEAKKELGLSALSGQDGRFSGVYSPLTGTSLTFNSVARLTMQFSITLSALEHRGLVKIKASPRIATKSGKQASINVSREENFRITIPSENVNVPLSQIEKIVSGILLRIRPWASIGSDQITVEITTEVSSSSGQASATALPTVSKKTAATSLILNNGETIIIGGLKTLDVMDATEKIPIIGSLPLLGQLFSKTAKRDKETELTFFITPHIIEDGAEEIVPDGE